MRSPQSPKRPWYREPWLWFLMAAPAASVVMGIAMWTLAVGTNDGLVADDYYKQGLAINRVLDREARAAALGVHGVLTFNPERTRARLQLEGLQPVPGQVTLRLVHPTRAGEDQEIALAASAGAVLEGALRPPAAGRWRIVIEDPGGAWRLSTTWDTRAATAPLEAAPRPSG